MHGPGSNDHPAPPRGPDPTEYIALAALAPGDERLRTIFTAYWPAYERWFLREGDAKRPSFARCRRALRESMPELLPLYDALCQTLDAGDAAARFLGLYRPTPFMAGCSQAVWVGSPPETGPEAGPATGPETGPARAGQRDREIALVRNYDYAPDLFEGINLLSAWTGPRIIGMTDCFWGLLDGMNEHGLVVALAFGGRKAVGDGFAIPLILRYVLETCRTTEQAIDALKRVPSHMAYNLLIVDRRAKYATVQLAPDREVRVLDARACTNHQGEVEWKEHAQLTRTVEREQYLLDALDQPSETLPALVDRFFRPPLYMRGRFRKWCTLYTGVYGPSDGTCQYLWPSERWEQTFDEFTERGEVDALTATTT